MDRDDIIDVEIDIVPWIKGEMRMMLDEEIARASLVGDGRLSSDDDKINEDHIRPIWKDADLYTIKSYMEVKAGATDDEIAKKFIRLAIKSRKDYKGSGNPTLFTTEDMLTNLLLLEDVNGRIIYDSEAKLATTLRVSKIVTVPVMENLSRDDNGVTKDLMGIIVNPQDYNIGADKGGGVATFSDFDINFNQEIYLMETRCSGALIKPYSAIVLEKTTTAA
jgi:HK97 family phage major capsid protein